jgi:hypothetical protein
MKGITSIAGLTKKMTINVPANGADKVVYVKRQIHNSTKFMKTFIALFGAAMLAVIGSGCATSTETGAYAPAEHRSI